MYLEVYYRHIDRAGLDFWLGVFDGITFTVISLFSPTLILYLFSVHPIYDLGSRMCVCVFKPLFGNCQTSLSLSLLVLFRVGRYFPGKVGQFRNVRDRNKVAKRKVFERGKSCKRGEKFSSSFFLFCVLFFFFFYCAWRMHAAKLLNGHRR